MSCSSAYTAPSMLRRIVGIPSALDYTARLIEVGGCRTALDLGCGKSSYLAAFKPRLTTAGVDAFPGAIEEAKANHVHDDYLLADLLETSPAELLAQFGGKKFDLVTLYDVIEHVPKRQGYELLERCEQLARRYVLVQTPNGFVEQGPEFGNEFQRHRSGWFAHDFEGLGYQVRGAGGLKWFHGYAGQFKWRIPGLAVLDALLFRVRRAAQRPAPAFTLIAWKDLQGAPARLTAENRT